MLINLYLGPLVTVNQRLLGVHVMESVSFDLIYTRVSRGSRTLRREEKVCLLPIIIII